MVKFDILIIEKTGDELESIKNVVCENNNDIGLVLTANSMKDGFELYQMHQPGFVIVNVDLDSSQDLSCIEYMNDRASFLMISSRTDLDFIRNILTFNTYDYLSKPYRVDELRASFSNCIKKLKKQDAMIKDIVSDKVVIIKPELDNLILNDIIIEPKMDRVLNFLRFYNITMYEGLCVLLPENVSDEQMKSFLYQVNTYEVYVFQTIISEIHMLLIISEETMSKTLLEYLEDKKKKFYQTNIMIGIGSIKQDVMNLHESYLEAMVELNKYSIPEVSTDLQERKVNEKLQFNYIKIIKDYLLSNMDAYYEGIRELSMLLQIYKRDDITRITKEIICFSVEYIQQMFHDFQVNDLSVYSIQINEDQRFLSIHRQVHQIFNQLLQPINIHEGSNAMRILQEADKYIRINFKKPLTLEHLSLHLNVSTYYICRIFQEYLGVSFVDEVNMYRVDEAKKLLLTEKRIKDIAYEVGYKSSTYFGRIFKQNMGITPNDYRLKYCANKKQLVR